MKTIGLLGGTAWPSTIEYYRYLNQIAQRYYGGRHSASLLLKSIDYAPIAYCYGHDWALARQRFMPELQALYDLAPDCIVVCCNTLHRAIDELADTLPSAPPLIHIVTETARMARQHGHRRVLLLGTQFTMENGYYAERLSRSGLEVVTPERADRKRIQSIQSAVADGLATPQANEYFHTLLQRYADCDSAVLACTELPAVIDAASSPIPTLDPMRIQCDAAFEFAVAEPSADG
ncbi:amino acid racemase [Salinisphaera sp. SPP-AMP-43]|uniref:aspartate/glutamate racemase family protein n=1 Tax=Salinisphaera sp. SPP-AMP-43 TaxID=3121288 RepID=UPI003C6E1632